MSAYNIEYVIFALCMIATVIAGLGYLFVEMWRTRKKVRQQYWDDYEKRKSARMETPEDIVSSLSRHVSDVKNQGSADLDPKRFPNHPRLPGANRQTPPRHKAPTRQSSSSKPSHARGQRPYDRIDDDSLMCHRQPASVTHSPVHHHETDCNDTPSYRQCDRSPDYDSPSSDSGSSDSGSSPCD